MSELPSQVSECFELFEMRAQMDAEGQRTTESLPESEVQKPLLEYSENKTDKTEGEGGHS